MTTFAEFKTEFAKKLFDEYRVMVDLVDIVGGIPADPELIDSWMRATNKAMSDEERNRIINATAEELPEVVEEAGAKGWTRFKRDEIGPYIEGRQIKSALKENANILKTTLTPTKKNASGKKGITALKKKVSECVFVVEDRIYLERGDKFVTGDIPTEERPIHAMTPRGPITSLKRTDVLYDVSIRFTVRLAKTGEVTEEALFACIAYLEHNGIGADRSQGRGRAKMVDAVKVD